MRSRGARVLFVATLTGCVLAGAAGNMPAARAWAPLATATIHPGVQTRSPAGQCTAAFVFRYQSMVFLGQAAHCTGTGGPTDTNGCETKSLPIGTLVDIQGASHPGRLHYSSWFTMAQVKETNPDICEYNDFALIQVHPADVRRVNPSVPTWGGPRGQNITGTTSGSEVYSYGNSGLRAGITALSPKVGFSTGMLGGGWSHRVYTATPGIPGDSGSALLDGQGRAAGIAATISPLGSNNFADLNHALYYAAYHGKVVVQLVPGTARFRDLL